MSARLIEGKQIAATIRSEIKTQVVDLCLRGVQPALTMIRVGQDPGSVTYMNAKAKASEEVGIKSRIVELPQDSGEEKVSRLLQEINGDSEVHGIIVQLPLPVHLNALRILSRLDPEKDVDGFHPMNVGRLSMGEPLFVPATALGVKELLDKAGISIEGAHVVIIGRSNVVGRPLASYLGLRRAGFNATVTLCHSSSRGIEKIARSADVLVSAIGKAGFVNSSMVSPGVVVVDVGMNRIADSSSPTGRRLVGDVKFEDVSEVASAITPVPGGVGPMTVAMLLRNTIQACKAQTRK